MELLIPEGDTSVSISIVPNGMDLKVWHNGDAATLKGVEQSNPPSGDYAISPKGIMQDTPKNIGFFDSYLFIFSDVS
jgi:hypothetical protein